MATRAEHKLFGLRSDAVALRDAAKVVRRREWAPKFSTAMKRLADEITAEADALATEIGED